MMKKVITIEVNKELGLTDVTIHVPGFKNFGKRLGDLERKASEAIMADTTDSEPLDEPTKNLVDFFDLPIDEMRKKIEAMPEGQDKRLMRSSLQMKMMLQSWDEADDEQGQIQDATAEQGGTQRFIYKLDTLRISLSEGKKWNKATQTKVDKFLEDWPQLRSAVLKATFHYYRDMYSELYPVFGANAGGKFTMPKPTGAKAVSDLFCINTIYFRSDSAIGIGGHCTWDDEHGYGALIENNKVVDVGYASVAFD